MQLKFKGRLEKYGKCSQTVCSSLKLLKFHRVWLIWSSMVYPIERTYNTCNFCKVWENTSGTFKLALDPFKIIFQSPKHYENII